MEIDPYPEKSDEQLRIFIESSFASEEPNRAEFDGVGEEDQDEGEYIREEAWLLKPWHYWDDISDD